MPTRPVRILLVEDHVDTAMVLTRLLRRSGYDVVHATTVASALSLAEREMLSTGLDLVLSDLALPDGNGFDVMRQLSVKHGLRGIALTGFGMDSDKAEGIKAGFSRYLTKPINIATLRKAIAEMM